MLQLKCLLIGNQQTGKILFEHVSKVPWLSFICKPINAREARHYLQEFATDIIFCDMATISDTEMENFLADYAHNSLIIVVDSRTALSGSDIGSNVFSFLQRPVSFDQFFYAVCRAKEYLYPPVQQEYTPAADFVFVKSEYKFYKVKFDDILFCEGMKDYTQVYLVDKPKPIITLQNLKTFVSKLPAHDFIRVHRSYVISLSSIDVVSKNEIVIGNKFIPIGESYRNSLFQIIHQAS
jgi:DNA-binding LytR/AlgR family response regulator